MNLQFWKFGSSSQGGTNQRRDAVVVCVEDDDNFGDENGSDLELVSAMLLSGEAEEPPAQIRRDSVVCHVC
jgi:hypothetical protein